MTVLTADGFDDTRARTNVKRLAAAQALTGANAAVIFATGAIVGATLAPDVSLATLPISIYVLGLAAGTLPTGMISQAFGRRAAFIIGTGCGALCGLLAALAIYWGSFALFCCATFLGGLYGAVSQSYRFAATDSASPEYRPKALSWVMAGGVLSTVTVKLGPAAGAVLPAVSVPVPAAMEIPKGPSPLISLRVTVRVVPEPDTASVPVAVSGLTRVRSPAASEAEAKLASA